VSDVKRRSWRK